MAETKSVKAIARQQVEALLAKTSEPHWLRDDRLKSWESYERTPWPSAKDEDWRRTDISQLQPESLPAADLQPTTPSKSQLPDLLLSLKEFNRDFAGVIDQSALRPGCLELDFELSKQGVIFCSLPEAIDKHAELLEALLTANNPTGTNAKFALLNRALFNSGTFLYVPDNLEIKLPFLSAIEYGSQPTAAFPRLVVSLGKNSRAQLIQVFTSQNHSAEDSPSLISGSTDIHLAAGAHLSYLEVQNLNSSTVCINHVSNNLKRHANLKSATVATGGQLTKTEIITRLQEPGADSTVLGVVLGNDSQHYNFNTIQEHLAPDTNSDINFRVALNDSASSLYQGVIRVDKIAQRICAYQSNKNLLLGEQSKADSIPKLEILADDVKCSHGATVGPVDAEQVFYLNSRGLSPEEAQELIVLGFFRQVLERLDINGTAEWLSAVLSPKLSHQHR